MSNEQFFNTDLEGRIKSRLIIVDRWVTEVESAINLELCTLWIEGITSKDDWNEGEGERRSTEDGENSDASIETEFKEDLP